MNPRVSAALMEAGESFHEAAEHAENPHNSHVYDVMAYHSKMLVYTTQPADPDDRDSPPAGDEHR